MVLCWQATVFIMALEFFHGLLSQSATWLILAGLVAPLSPGLAQTSGQMTLTGSFTYSYDQLQHGSTTFTAVGLEGGAIVSMGRGVLFPKGQGFLESCVGFAEESTDGSNVKVNSYCTLTESKEDGGDVLFVLGVREQGDLGAADRGGMGRVDLVGGTGKYANLTGECSYETRYLSTSTAVTTLDCTWSKP